MGSLLNKPTGFRMRIADTSIVQHLESQILVFDGSHLISRE